MNKIRIFACTALIVSLAACNDEAPAKPTAAKPSAAANEPESALGRLVSKEINEAREKLATENISLNGNVRVNAGKDGDVAIFDGEDKNDTRPKGEITPKGDLLIDGKAVAINADQRAMLLDYRGHVIKVAESGMEIGIQGADLAAKAMGEAFKGIFSGKSEQEIEKSVEAEAGKIKQAAVKLCDQLPPMMASQQKLATAVPEFKPYATMEKDDIDECMKEARDEATVTQAEVRTEVREEIRSTVRDAVRGGAREATASDTKDADAGKN